MRSRRVSSPLVCIAFEVRARIERVSETVCTLQLVAGSSSGSSSGDAVAGGDADDAGAAKGDNLTEGVPGPITRLFIIANRGIANLIQDLILRIAQTSERIVNFKARLITSII